MNTWSFCDPETGLFLFKVFKGPDRALAANTPNGAIAILGKHDPLQVRVDWNTGEIVELDSSV